MIVRGEFTTPFVPVWNATARDRRLSFRARGVLTYILSLPPGGRTTIPDIAAEGTEGREAIATAMRELEAAGYVRRVRVRNERGQIRTDTHVYGRPEDAAAHAPDPDGPDPGNPSPVPPAETRESPGQTGPQETGLRRTGAVKEKTGTTKTGENEPLPDAVSDDGTLPGMDGGRSRSRKAAPKQQQRAKGAHYATAQDIARAVWERPRRPGQSFIGIRKVIEGALAAGWPAEAVRAAAMTVATMTTAALDVELHRTFPDPAGPPAAGRAATPARLPRAVPQAPVPDPGCPECDGRGQTVTRDEAAGVLVAVRCGCWPDPDAYDGCGTDAQEMGA